jgi:hypothetical protein
MKKIKHIALSLALSLPLMGISQEGQMEASTNGDGTYTEYAIKYDKETKEYQITGCCGSNWQISSQPYHGNYKILSLEKILETGKARAAKYFVDEEAFPASFKYGHRFGNKEEIEKYDVVNWSPELRVVFVGEWVYVLKKWKDKDNYLIANLLKKQDQPLKGLKSMKAALAAAKSGEGPVRAKELQDYLDKAYNKQAELLPAWKKENAAAIAKSERNRAELIGGIKAENDAVEAERARREAAKKSPKPGTGYTIKNTTGSDVQVNCNGAIYTISSGSSKEFNCITDVHYNIKVGGHSKEGALIADGSDSCGKNIEL